MPEDELSGVTHLNADWIKQNLDKGRFLLALRARRDAWKLAHMLIRRTLLP